MIARERKMNDGAWKRDERGREGIQIHKDTYHTSKDNTAATCEKHSQEAIPDRDDRRYKARKARKASADERCASEFAPLAFIV